MNFIRYGVTATFGCMAVSATTHIAPEFWLAVLVFGSVVVGLGCSICVKE